ncbi:MAG: hypothetical protein CM15mP84_05830 [Cellvibrionales bacterium]|nr:MAG: hypothetical protein CM15mP84_05830 [Cellvibrionales bacterium]
MVKGQFRHRRAVAGRWQPTAAVWGIPRMRPVLMPGGVFLFTGAVKPAIQADVSCEADVLAMFHEIEGAAGILVTPGIAHASPVESLEVGDFDPLMGVHFGYLPVPVGLVSCMKNRGRIINTASQLA